MKGIINMKIYVSHSSKYDYMNKLYSPIKKSSLNKDNLFFFPHDNKEIINTKDIIESYDLVLAEVSLSATGQGIELGWANYAHTPILCIYEKGKEISSSLKFITDDFIEYENNEDVIEKLENYILKKNSK